MSKHTPGPWTYVHEDDGSLKYLATVARVGAYYVGTLSDQQGGYYDLHCREEDDARVIAAAPQLLILAQLIVELDRLISREDMLASLNIITGHARDAVAIATPNARGTE